MQRASRRRTISAMRVPIPPMPGIAIGILAMVAFVLTIATSAMPLPLGITFGVFGVGLLAYEVYSITEKTATDSRERIGVHRRLDVLDKIASRRDYDCIRRLFKTQQKVQALARDYRTAEYLVDQDKPAYARSLELALKASEATADFRDNHATDLNFLLGELTEIGIVPDDDLLYALDSGVTEVEHLEFIAERLGTMIDHIGVK